MFFFKTDVVILNESAINAYFLIKYRNENMRLLLPRSVIASVLTAFNKFASAIFDRSNKKNFVWPLKLLFKEL